MVSILEQMHLFTRVGGAEDMLKFAKRSVRVTKEHNEDCKKLLRLMGVPIIEAPCEAEAQCAAMVRAGKVLHGALCASVTLPQVYATGTEDMDALTLGTPILIRHLTFSEARKIPIKEIYLDKVLAGLGFTMDQFIDLCILLGCDYCDTIKGEHNNYNPAFIAFLIASRNWTKEGSRIYEEIWFH